MTGKSRGRRGDRWTRPRWRVGSAFLVNAESDIVVFVHCFPPGRFVRRPVGLLQCFPARRTFSSLPYTLKPAAVETGSLSCPARRAVNG